jgi:hypothetical protein
VVGPQVGVEEGIDHRQAVEQRVGGVAVGAQGRNVARQPLGRDALTRTRAFFAGLQLTGAAQPCLPVGRRPSRERGAGRGGFSHGPDPGSDGCLCRRLGTTASSWRKAAVASRGLRAGPGQPLPSVSPSWLGSTAIGTR